MEMMASIEVVEGVLVRRDLGPHPLQSLGVEPHQRDAEPGPEFLLELGQDGFECHDEDAFAPAPLDQFGQQDADLQRLADADAVEDADGGPQSSQRPVGRDKLIPGEVQRRLVAEVDLVVGGRRAAQQAFQVEPGAPVLRAVVGHEVGVLGPHLHDFVEGGEERPFLVADKLRHADDPDGVPAGGDGHGRPNQPFLVPDDNTGARRQDRLCRHNALPLKFLSCL